MLVERFFQTLNIYKKSLFTIKSYIILTIFQTKLIVFFYSEADPINERYDFIVIGSGPTGSVIANRLSEIPQWKVLLIEAGDEPSIINEIPFIAGALEFTNYNWGYKAEKQEGFCKGNRAISIHRALSPHRWYFLKVVPEVACSGRTARSWGAPATSTT